MISGWNLTSQEIKWKSTEKSKNKADFFQYSNGMKMRNFNSRHLWLAICLCKKLTQKTSKLSCPLQFPNCSSKLQQLAPDAWILSIVHPRILLLLYLWFGLVQHYWANGVCNCTVQFKNKWIHFPWKVQYNVVPK